MYHTVIIDDDQLARRGLRRILEQNFPEIQILGEADSVASGIKLIDEVDPDLVFLDIEMPDGTVRSTINRINEIPVLREKQRVEVLKKNLRPGNEDDATIALPEINGFTIVKVKDIVRCEGERNYSRIFFVDGRSVLISRTLLEFDNMLVSHGFFRIHRSHLISLRNVNRYLKTDGGVVEMIDKLQLPVSPKFKEELLNRLLYNRI